MKDAEGLGWHAGGLGAGDLVWKLRPPGLGGRAGMRRSRSARGRSRRGRPDAAGDLHGPAKFRGWQYSGAGKIQVGIAR